MKTLRCLFAAVSILAVAGAAQAQVVQIAPFVGDYTESFETQQTGGFLPCISGRVFNNTADLCTSQGSGCHLTGGWSYLCSIQEHSGSYLFGNNAPYPEYTFDDPIWRFGGYFGTQGNPGTLTVNFYDAANALVGTDQVAILTCGDWYWYGWESQGGGVSRIEIINSEHGGNYVMMDDMEVVADCDETDADQDGWDLCSGDCDDNDPLLNLDDVDQDGFNTCDGDCDDNDAALNLADADGDHYTTCDNPMDCDDSAPEVYPGALELCDQMDNDCDPNTDENVDNDNDGFSACQDDCNDTDPALNPADVDQDTWSTCEGDCDDNDAALNLDDVDQDTYDTCEGDCDDNDATLNLDDLDADSWTTCDGDCNDNDADISPGAMEACNGLDDNCDGSPANYEQDNDGDGFMECEECDDTDINIYPGAPDDCTDGVDSDCAGDLWYETDDDGDGLSECDGDCDDEDGDVNPSADEICNGGVDDDCNPATDENGDTDSDGYSICEGDCDDYDFNSNPGADEVCDGVDNDCNGMVDDGIDYDLDGYSGCDDEDCDDYNPNVFPGATEIPYDGIDQDCDGADLTDVDGDTYDGGPYGDDCDDADPTVNPGATENCDDGIDSDCDGLGDLSDPDCGGGDDDDTDGGPVGCSCDEAPGVAGGAPASLVLLGVLGLLITRRSRR